MQALSQRPTHNRTGSGGVKKFESVNGDTDPTTTSLVRTDSPDNDSAFSDNVSMLSSSESSASSGASGGGGLSSKNDTKRHNNMMDHSAMVKAEKIKMALEKLKEANVKKLFIKAFTTDGSTKSLLVDEKMSVGHVTRLLADKNHVRIDPKWTIVEQLPDLYMERIYEDDEMLVDNLLLWTRDSQNKLLFVERMFKFDFFIQPEKYLMFGSTDVEDETRNSLLEECFANGRIPEIEGPLFLKSEGKKAWKKLYFVLRKSGLYYCPKGKNSKSSRDLICLAKFDSNQVYQGFNWKKKYKAPTEFGFALKHPHLQTKNAKLIKYLCTEDENSLFQWIMGIRVAKCGHKMAENYRTLVEDIAQEDIDMLASSRSFSLASVSGSSRGTSQATTPSSESRSLDSCLTASVADDDSSAESSQDTPVNTLSRVPIWRQESIRSSTSSSSSSGCLSERSSTGTPTGEHGFEAEFPQGTIKRKPSGNPKLPLTTTTRHLVKEVEDDNSRSSTLRRPKKTLSEEVSTLRRRNSANTSKTSLVSSMSSVCTDEKIPPKKVDIIPASTTEEYVVPSADFLPPPPPELLASTLSLNSLPPPPEECSLTTFPEEMSVSMISLPPPPPPSTTQRPISPPLPMPNMFIPMSPPRNRSSLPRPTSPPPNVLPKPLLSSAHNNILHKSLSPPHSSQPQSFPSPPPTPPKPVLHQPISPPAVAPKPFRKVSFDSIVQTRTEEPQFSLDSNNIYENNVRPPSNLALLRSPLKKKKISFVDQVEILPPSPTSPVKPPLPRRADATRLSAPGKLDSPGCKVTPPRSFLSNLQKVMQKKWQVAEKCRDFDKMPHEVLGFRDPVPQSETEKNVGAWIQEHYGCLYENLSPNPPQASTIKTTQSPSNEANQSRNSTSSTVHVNCNKLPSLPKRKPPPLPPKRADTTQLSTRQ